MKITLNDGEIKEAISQYINYQGITIKDKNVVVAMTAGRGGNGYSATIDICTPEDTEVTATNIPTSEPTSENTPEVPVEEADGLFGE